MIDCWCGGGEASGEGMGVYKVERRSVKTGCWMLK